MKAVVAILFSCCTLFSAGLSAAGVDGQWEAITPGRRSPVLLELKSEGSRLTGWLSQPNGKLGITNGSIDGAAVSFEMAVTMNGQALTLLYSGKLEGDELHLSLSARG